jgi:DHA1 family bicyclomycin/chloramphenicol resistance-like MFS transporter
MLISLALGTLIGQVYNGTVLPLVVGFAVLSACAILTTRWAEAGSLGRHDARVAAVDTGGPERAL